MSKWFLLRGGYYTSLLSLCPRVKINTFGQGLPFASSLLKPVLDFFLWEPCDVSGEFYVRNFSAGYPGVAGLFADFEEGGEVFGGEELIDRNPPFAVTAIIPLEDLGD